MSVLSAPRASIAGLVLTTLLFAACSGDKNTPVSEGTKNQILHIGNGTEPADLDPHVVTGVPEHKLIMAFFEGLVMPHPKTLAPEPGMAESWSVSRDQKTYTFKIRKNGKWSNGDSYNANDVLYSWKRCLSPALGSEYAYMLFSVKNAEQYNKGELKDFAEVGVKALDDYTLQVTLANPTPYFLSLLSHYSTWPVHKATIEKFGKVDERGTPWTRAGNLVGNGPFILKKWEMNKIIVAERNPNYWDAEKVRLKEIHFYPVDNLATEERMFRSGQIHITSTVPPDKIEVYAKENPELIRINPYLGTYYYRINVTKKPFDDARVRRAFAMSVDRKTLVEKVSKGGELPSFSFVPADTAGYTPQHSIPYDIEGAKKLLADAGFPEGKGLPKAELLYNTSEGHQKIAQALQQMWKVNLGVEVALVNQDWKVYLASQKAMDYFMARAGWIGDYADPTTFMDMFVTGGGNNQTGWSNKEYDRLIRQAAETGSQEARYAIFQKAEKILLEEAPIIPLYTYTNKALISPDVKGWEKNILDNHPYKYVHLSSEGEAGTLSKK
ncbi:MAG: peptide ABC transporter substrate-binding protein [Bdellovibrionales bacterium]|nr:peptide ABC transporter substrate-binding protein [Bdellovibrionales bacterium]